MSDRGGDDSGGPAASPFYVLGQLAKALTTAKEHPDTETKARAEERVGRWTRVFQGMLEGTLGVGSRTPVEGTPAWATIEVVTGGFATGTLLAEGPLQDHERARIKKIGSIDDPRVRTALNASYLTEAGLAELRSMLRQGTYRIRVPEEGALLVVAWLLEHGRGDIARDLLDALGAWFPRLRFYPVPHDHPLTSSALIRLQDVSATIKDLESVRERPVFASQRESARVWAPLYDRAVELLLKTVEGELPRIRPGEKGQPVRKANGWYAVDGGWPCQRYPDGWKDLAKAFLSESRELRAAHKLCLAPEGNRTFARLRRFISEILKSPLRLSGRDVGLIRTILAGVLHKRGAPGSDRLRTLRAFQERQVAGPTSKEFASVLAVRLRSYPRDGGLTGIEPVSGDVTTEEADRHRIPAKVRIPERMCFKLLRSLDAPIEDLVEKGVIPSGEVLARVIPQITAHIKVAGIGDPDLRRLYSAIYTSFRRRRSLLLLNYEHQIRLEELPWVQAIEAERKMGLAERESARLTLEQLVALTLTSFPHVILPNKLLQEVRMLSKTADIDIPIVDELAADIFMGDFTEKFLQSTQIAGRLLRGTLYERYYEIDYRDFDGMVVPSGKKGPRLSKDFGNVCYRRANESRPSGWKWGWSVAHNGKVIEQSQILTTHNLAALVNALGLSRTLGGWWEPLGRACFSWICHRLQIRITQKKAQLQRLKNCAYAWRQMVFYLSLVPSAQERFFAWAEAHLQEQPESFAAKFRPALIGLRQLGQGRLFLGWTTEPHWLIT